MVQVPQQLLQVSPDIELQQKLQRKGSHVQNLSSHLHTYQGYVGKLSKYQIYVTYNSKIKIPGKHAVWRA